MAPGPTTIDKKAREQIDDLKKEVKELRKQVTSLNTYLRHHRHYESGVAWVPDSK